MIWMLLGHSQNFEMVEVEGADIPMVPARPLHIPYVDRAENVQFRR
jgi:hypothetical protein